MAETLERVHGTLAQMQKNLECSICLELLTDPVLTRCEHHFCNFCILALLQSRRRQTAPCPLCKEPVTKRGLIKHESLKNIVDAYRNIVNAVEDDTGKKCTPPRGPVRFSQPEPVSQRPKLPVKKTGTKSNVRRGKRRGVPPIAIHLDPSKEDGTVQEPGKMMTYNINTRPSFPSSKKTTKQPASDPLGERGCADENHLPGISQSMQAPDILAALAEASLGHVVIAQNEEAPIQIINHSSDRILAEKMVNGGNKLASADPYEFIASQRTPRKVKKRAPKEKKKKRPWEYSFGKISKKKKNVANGDVRRRQDWQSDEDDDEDSSLVHREDIGDHEEHLQGGQRTVSKLPDVQEVDKGGCRVEDVTVGVVGDESKGEEMRPKNGKEEREDEDLHRSTERNGRVDQRVDVSDDDDFINDLDCEVSDEGVAHLSDGAHEQDGEGMGDKGRRKSASKALDAIKNQRDSSGEFAGDSHGPLEKEGNMVPLFEETQEPPCIRRTKGPLNVQQRPYFNPSNDSQEGMPPSQPPVLNRNHGKKVFAKTYGKGKTKSPPKDERVKPILGEGDDLPDVMSIDVDADDAESTEGGSQEVSLEDVGLQDEMGDHGPDPLTSMGDVNALEKDRDVAASDEENVVDLTLEDEKEGETVDETALQTGEECRARERDRETDKNQSIDEDHIEKMVPEAMEEGGQCGDDENGPVARNTTLQKNDLIEDDMNSGNHDARRCDGGAGHDVGEICEESGGSSRKKTSLKEKMRNKEGLDLQEQNDWEIALELAKELGSVPPDLEVPSLRARKDNNSSEASKDQGRRGRRGKQLTIENGPKSAAKTAKFKRGRGHGGLRSLEENDQQETFEISSFKDDSGGIGQDLQDDKSTTAEVDVRQTVNIGTEKRTTRARRKKGPEDKTATKVKSVNGNGQNSKRKTNTGKVKEGSANDAQIVQGLQEQNGTQQEKVIGSDVVKERTEPWRAINGVPGVSESDRPDENCQNENVVEAGASIDEGRTVSSLREIGTPEDMVKCVPETPFIAGVNLGTTVSISTDVDLEVVVNEAEGAEETASSIQRNETKKGRGNRGEGSQVGSGKDRDTSRKKSGKKQIIKDSKRFGSRKADCTEKDKICQSTRRTPTVTQIGAVESHDGENKSRGRNRGKHSARGNKNMEQPDDSITDQRYLRKSSRLSKEKVECEANVMDAGGGDKDASVVKKKETLSTDTGNGSGRRKSSRLQEDKDAIRESCEVVGEMMTDCYDANERILLRGGQRSEIVETNEQKRGLLEEQLQRTEGGDCQEDVEDPKLRMKTGVERGSMITGEEQVMRNEEVDVETSVQDVVKGKKSTKRLQKPEIQQRISTRSSRSQDKKKRSPFNNSSVIVAEDDLPRDIHDAAAEDDSDHQSLRGSAEVRLSGSRERKKKRTGCLRTSQADTKLQGSKRVISDGLDKCSEVIIRVDDNEAQHEQSIVGEEGLSETPRKLGQEKGLRRRLRSPMGRNTSNDGNTVCRMDVEEEGMLDLGSGKRSSRSSKSLEKNPAKLGKRRYEKEPMDPVNSSNAGSDVALFEEVINDEFQEHMNDVGQSTRGSKGTQKSPSSTIRGAVSGSSTESIQIDDGSLVYAESDVLNGHVQEDLLSKTSPMKTLTETKQGNGLTERQTRKAASKSSRTLRNRKKGKCQQSEDIRSEDEKDGYEAGNIEETRVRMDSRLASKDPAKDDDNGKTTGIGMSMDQEVTTKVKELARDGGNDRTICGSKNEIRGVSDGDRFVGSRGADSNTILVDSRIERNIEKTSEEETDENVLKTMEDKFGEGSVGPGSEECEERSPDIFTMHLGEKQDDENTAVTAGGAGKKFNHSDDLVEDAVEKSEDSRAMNEVAVEVSKHSDVVVEEAGKEYKRSDALAEESGKESNLPPKRGRGKKKRKRKTFAFGNEEASLEESSKTELVSGEEPILQKSDVMTVSGQKSSQGSTKEDEATAVEKGIPLENGEVGQITQMTSESNISEQFVPATMGASESFSVGAELPGLRRRGSKSRGSGERPDDESKNRHDKSLEGRETRSQRDTTRKARGKRTSNDEASGKLSKRYCLDLSRKPCQEADDDDEGSIVPPTQPTAHGSKGSAHREAREGQDYCRNVEEEEWDGERISMVDTFERIEETAQSAPFSQRKMVEEGSLSLGSPSISLLQGVEMMDEAEERLDEDMGGRHEKRADIEDGSKNTPPVATLDGSEGSSTRSSRQSRGGLGGTDRPGKRTSQRISNSHVAVDGVGQGTSQSRTRKPMNYPIQGGELWSAKMDHGGTGLQAGNTTEDARSARREGRKTTGKVPVLVNGNLPEGKRDNISDEEICVTEERRVTDAHSHARHVRELDDDHKTGEDDATGSRDEATVGRDDDGRRKIAVKGQLAEDCDYREMITEHQEILGGGGKNAKDREDREGRCHGQVDAMKEAGHPRDDEGVLIQDVLEDGDEVSVVEGGVYGDGKGGKVSGSKSGKDLQDNDIYDAEYGEEPLFEDDCASLSSVNSRHNLTSASSVLSSQSDLMNSQQQENAKETLWQMKQEIAEMERALAEEAGIAGERAATVEEPSDDSDLEAVDLGVPGIPENTCSRRSQERRKSNHQVSGGSKRAATVEDPSDDSDLEAVDLSVPRIPENTCSRRSQERRKGNHQVSGGMTVIDRNLESCQDEGDDVKVSKNSNTQKSQGEKSRIPKSQRGRAKNIDDDHSDEEARDDRKNWEVDKKRHSNGNKKNKNVPKLSDLDDGGNKVEDIDDAEDMDAAVSSDGAMDRRNIDALSEGMGKCVSPRETGLVSGGQKRSTGEMGGGQRDGRRSSRSRWSIDSGRKGRNSLGKFREFQGIDSIEDKEMAEDVRSSVSGMAAAEESLNSIMKTLAERRHKEEAAEREREAGEQSKGRKKRVAPEVEKDRTTPSPLEVGPSPSSPRSPSPPPAISQRTLLQSVSTLEEEEVTRVDQVKRKISGDGTHDAAGRNEERICVEGVKRAQAGSRCSDSSGTSIGSQKKRRRVVVEESSSEDEGVCKSQREKVQKPNLSDSTSPPTSGKEPVSTSRGRAPLREMDRRNTQRVSPAAGVSQAAGVVEVEASEMDKRNARRVSPAAGVVEVEASEMDRRNAQRVSPAAGVVEVVAGVTYASKNKKSPKQSQMTAGSVQELEGIDQLSESMACIPETASLTVKQAQVMEKVGRSAADTAEETRGTSSGQRQNQLSVVSGRSVGEGQRRKKPRKGESMSLITTGLNKHKMKLVDQLCKKAGCRFSSVFTTGTTHVIVNADEELTCERTLKYFQGIAARRWIISYQWVHDNLSASRLLPQEKYEIRGDTVNGRNHCGPRRSRLWKGPPLLSDYSFYCMEPFTGLTTDQLCGLLSSCGAKVVACPDHLPLQESGKESLIIAQVDATETPPDYNALYQKLNIPIISREWVLDSIAVYTAQPINDYLLCDVIEDEGDLQRLDSDDEF